MKTKYKFIRFEKAEPHLIPEFAHGREVWLIKTRDDALLGSVTYYGPWRQMCLFPQPNTVWSTGCLNDVISFIGEMVAEKSGK